MSSRSAIVSLFLAPTRLAALSIALCASLPVAAATFCVSTGEELSQILNGPGVNASNNGQDDIILLRSGRYTSEAGAVGGVTWFFAAQDGRSLSISGGWNSNCTTQAIDPTVTTLDANNSRAVLHIVSANPSILAGQLSISNLTLAKGRTTFAETPTVTPVAALRISLQASTGAGVTVENVIITGSTAAPVATGSHVANIRVVDGGIVRFRNNVIYGNNLSGASSTANLVIFAAGGAVALVSNNSVFSNAVSSSKVGLAGDGAMTLSNNVLAENTTTAPFSYQLSYTTLMGSTSGLTLVNNHITSREGSPVPPFSEINTTTGPTMWSGTGPFRVPDVGSPLRDSGSNSVAGGLSSTDARGLPRVVNTVVDRGAVEAQPPANTGPTITALEPLANSTTILQATDGATQTTRVFFLTQSGNGTARTTVDCQVTAGNGAVVVRPVQSVANGGLALPVDVALDNPVAGAGDVQATLVCDVSRENAGTYALTYFFVVRDPQLFRNGFE